MKLVSKIIITAFYLILLLFSIVNFFSDEFIVWYNTTLGDYASSIDLSVFVINMLIVVGVIIYIWRSLEAKQSEKTLWTVLSIFFPVALIIFVWRVAPTVRSAKENTRY